MDAPTLNDGRLRDMVENTTDAMMASDAKRREDDSSPSSRRRADARALCRATCELLNLPLETSVTALTATMRFYARKEKEEETRGGGRGATNVNGGVDVVVGVDRASPELVVPSAVYLACKLEESILRLADVVNAARRLCSRGVPECGYEKIELDGRAGVRLTEEEAKARGEAEELAGYAVTTEEERESEEVVGTLYYEYKDRILELEQEVLRAMEYDLNTEQPHKFMFHIVHTIGGGDELACAASAALLNMLFEVDGFATEADKPHLAAAAVHLASLVLKSEGVQTSPNGDGAWWEVLGFDFAVMEAIEARYLLQKSGGGD
jgi:hypothetical protein